MLAALSLTAAIVHARQHKVLEPGVEDVGALSASLRVARADLREAADFERVYRIEGGKMMRRDGALTAVFNESEYVPSRTGMVPVVPAGTMWVIGDPSAGCTDGPRQAFEPMPAQQPFLMAGPTTGAPRPVKKPIPEGALAPAPRPLALKVGEAVAVPGDRRVGLLVCAAPQAILACDAEAAVKPAATSLPRSLDMSDEVYRRLRLREIARRHGPQD